MTTEEACAVLQSLAPVRCRQHVREHPVTCSPVDQMTEVDVYHQWRTTDEICVGDFRKQGGRLWKGFGAFED